MQLSHTEQPGGYQLAHWGQITVITCGTVPSNSHTMSVNFRGPLDADNVGKESFWTCQRNQDSIDCKMKFVEDSEKQEKIEEWSIRDPATHQVEQRRYTLKRAIDYCNQNPKMEIATPANAAAGAFTICPGFVSEFK
jgi:hypothetical protein